MTTTATTAPHRIAIAGASGRMGRMLIEAVLASPDCQLAAAIDRPDTAQLGQDAGLLLGQETGVLISADVRSALAQADYLIDFTRPEGTLAHLAICAELGVKTIIGTTGFDEAQKAQIAQYAQQAAVVFAPNMSVGVNVTLKLLELAAKVLPDYDVEIIEATTSTRWMPPLARPSKWAKSSPKPRTPPYKTALSMSATATPASASPAPSALPPYAVATSSASTPPCSLARASA